MKSSGGIFDVEQLSARIEEIDAISQAPDFWENPEVAQSTMQERGEIVDTLEGLQAIQTTLDDIEALLELALESGDEECIEEAKACARRADSELTLMEKVRMLSGPHDTSNAIVTIKPGAGGTESQDWASILFRMYTRYIERKGWSIEIVDYQDGEEAGISKVEFLVTGSYAYGHLRAESGIHRLVRISPFDSNARRHTSFSAVTVVPEIDDSFEVDIKDSELRIDTYRASGAGGQHVNRTDSAVRITHLPTGIVVQCQNDRSQHKNKATAMKMLRSKLYEKELREREAEAQSDYADQSDVNFGSQIRSYVLHPYKQIKDLRTLFTVNNVDPVLDGDLDGFIEAYLLKEGSETADESV